MGGGILHSTFLRDDDNFNARAYFKYKVSHILSWPVWLKQDQSFSQTARPIFYDKADHKDPNTVTMCLSIPHATTFHLAYKIF